jgi:DNA-binding NarL/FixJ family response regulator
MPEPKQSIGEGVLLITADDPVGQSLLHAMEAATIDVEWARSIAELRARAARDDLRAPELVFLDLELPDSAIEDLVPLARTRFPHATIIALGSRLSGERAAQLLSQGVPSLSKPVSPLALAGLALRLSLAKPPSWAQSTAGWSRPRPSRGTAPTTPRVTHLESIFSSYSVDRELSKQQRMILRMYLDGMNDKEIAHICRCSEATVYEHWRRMAKKAGGSHKGDVISDFHRFLDNDS